VTLYFQALWKCWYSEAVLLHLRPKLKPVEIGKYSSKKSSKLVKFILVPAVTQSLFFMMCAVLMY